MPGSSRWLSSNFGHASGYRWAAASRRPSLKSIVAVTGSLAWAAVAENAPATAIETASPRNIGRVMRVRIGRLASRRSCRLLATVEQIDVALRRRTPCASRGAGTVLRRDPPRWVRAGRRQRSCGRGRHEVDGGEGGLALGLD